jgi:integrase
MKCNVFSAFEEYLHNLIQNKNTAKRYYGAVKNVFKGLGFEQISEIDVKTIEKQLAKIKTQSAFSATKIGLKHLKKFDKSLQLPSEDFFSKSCQKAKYTGKTKKIINKDRVHRKVNAVKDKKFKTAFRLMEVAGLRVSECAALQKRDISIVDGVIKFDVKHGKGGSNDVVECLQDKWLAENLPAFLVDFDENDKPFYSAATMKKKAWELGIECHDQRRLAADERFQSARDDGESRREAKQQTADFLRHSKTSTTSSYLPSARLKIVEKENKKPLTKEEVCGIIEEDRIKEMQEVSEKAEKMIVETDKKYYPDTLAGVSRDEPMTEAEANGGNVNPNFYESKEYRRNCQTCVVAY